MTVSFWEKLADRVEPKPPDPYLTDPVGWARDRLGVFLWSKQREIAEALVTHKKVAVKASHAVGKSHLAGVLATWWIDSHLPGEAFVASTAPTYPQVHAILWEEIRKQHTRGNLQGRVLQSDEWKTDTGTLLGYGRKPADTDQHAFQGIHRKYVLAVIDESCGVPEQLFTAVEAITTSDGCRILAIGNPDDPNTEFGKICRPGSGWHVITISALGSPNFTAEKIPEAVRPLLVAPEWVEDKKVRWGETSPRYVSKVLGEFPDISDDTLIPPKWIEAAQNRWREAGPDGPNPPGPSTLAVDVARFGTDRTILGVRQGYRFEVVKDIPMSRTTEVTGTVIVEVRDRIIDDVRVDVVGVGGGVADELVEYGISPVEMIAGSAPLDSERFKNARAEWWWGLRERFEQGDVAIDPADDQLAAQLGSIKYKTTARGQIQIESKEDMKKRGLPSPDRADTMMLAFAHTPEHLGDTVTDADLQPDELANFSISAY